jgi:hypothetical protein
MAAKSADKRQRLGAAVGRGSRRQQLGGERDGASEVPGAKVREEGPHVRTLHQNIVAFDVAVQAPHLMRGLQAPRHLRQQPRHLRLGGIAPSGPVVQRHALNELHDEVRIGASRMLPHAVVHELGHVGAVDEREQPRLVLEA